MANPPADAANGSGVRTGKVARLIDRYGLDAVGEELVEGWTAVGREHRSLRDLADEFNRRIIREALGEAGFQAIEGEDENIHRLLTDEDVSPGDRTRVERRLERGGIDVGALRDDLVSYQAVRTYLREDRGVEYDPGIEDRLGTERQNLQKLRGRVESVTRDKLGKLRRGDWLSVGRFDVLVNVTVSCRDCGERYDVGELLQSGGCSCSTVERDTE